jgi:hypothetical protein
VPEVVWVDKPPRAPRNPRLPAILSVVFAGVAIIAIPVGVFGSFIEIVAHADVTDDDQSGITLYAALALVGAILGVVAFFLGLFGLIRGPHRILSVVGMVLSFVPLLPLFAMWLTTVSVVSS